MTDSTPTTNITTEAGTVNPSQTLIPGSLQKAGVASHQQPIPGTPQRSSYGSKPKMAIPGMPISPVAPSASPAPQDASKTVSQEPTKVETSLAPQEASTASQEQKTEAPTEASSTKEETPAAKDTAKRLALISKQERKLAEDKRLFSEEKAKHATMLQKVEMLEKAHAQLHQNPMAFLQAMGVPMDKLFTQMIGQNNRSPQDQMVDQTQQMIDQKLETIRKEMADDKEKRQQADNDLRIRQYISGELTPLLSKDDYKHLKTEYGDQAPQQLWNAIVERKKNTGKWANPEEVVAMANQAESYYRKRAESHAQLLGLNSRKPSDTPKPETALADTKTVSQGNSKPTSDPSYWVQPRKGSYSVKPREGL